MKAKSLTSSNWASLAKSYGDFIHEKKILGPALNKIFSEKAIIGKQVADIGCGIGVYTEILVEQFYCEVFAFDISLEMIDIAQKSIRNSRAHFQVADAKKLPLQNNSMDIVLLSTLISNIESATDLATIFREAARILKPDGTAIISTPHPCFEMHSFPKRRERKFSKDYTYFSNGSPYSLELFKEGGAESVRVMNYHWTLEFLISSIQSSGLRIQEIIEPEPVELLGDETRYPVYLVALARKETLC